MFNYPGKSRQLFLLILNFNVAFKYDESIATDSKTVGKIFRKCVGIGVEITPSKPKIQGSTPSIVG